MQSHCYRALCCVSVLDGTQLLFFGVPIVKHYPVTLSDILSGRYFDILSDILSGIYFQVLSGISFDILSRLFWNSSDVSSEINCGRGPAGNTLIWSSRLRSGVEHCDQALAVEVRRGTL